MGDHISLDADSKAQSQSEHKRRTTLEHGSRLRLAALGGLEGHRVARDRAPPVVATTYNGMLCELAQAVVDRDRKPPRKVLRALDAEEACRDASPNASDAPEPGLVLAQRERPE
jgi:hypothetical protein